jgi:hypothetical protein
MIVSYTSSSVNKLKASLNDDARVIFYDHHMFIEVTRSYCLKVNLTSCHPNIVYYDSNTLAYFRNKNFYDTVLRKKKKCVPGKKFFFGWRKFFH